MRAGGRVRERAAYWRSAPLIDADWVQVEAKQGHRASPRIAFRIMHVRYGRAWRRFAAGTLACGALGFAGSALAQTVTDTTIIVKTVSDLVGAVQTVDSSKNAGVSYTINFQNNITLSAAASNTLAAFNSISTVAIQGNGFTLRISAMVSGDFTRW